MSLTMDSLKSSLSKTAQAATEATPLPNALYTDAEVFKFERDNVMAASWAAIGYSSDVPNSGCVHPVEFMGVPLLISRGRDLSLRVFHNVCSHRGMLLVRESAQLRTVIRCPYHSWSYDFDGKLMSTPHIGGVDRHQCEGFSNENHGLKQVRFAEWMGIVFINLSGAAQSFEQYIEPIEQRWQHFFAQQERQTITPAQTDSHLTLSLDCNWKLAVENYCEAYHLPWVHPALNSYSPLDQHYNIHDDEHMSGQGSLRYRLANVSGTNLPQIDGWPQDKLDHAEYLSLYPNTLLGIQADHFFSVVIIPKAANKTEERVQISYIGDGALDDKYAACRSAVLQSWETVFREDIFAVEGMQSGRASPGFEGGVFTPLQDLPTHHFHHWIASRYLECL